MKNIYKTHYKTGSHGLENRKETHTHPWLLPLEKRREWVKDYSTHAQMSRNQ